jgi:hypothetical protein
MTHTEASVVALLEGLKRQQDCVRQLVRLCDRQRELVDRGDAEGLLHLLGRRQGLIRELEEAEKQVVAFKSGWPASRDELPAVDRPLVERMLEEIEQALQRIIQQDEKDYRQLADAKQELGRQRRQAVVGQQVNAAYAAASGQPAGGRLLGNGDTA